MDVDSLNIIVFFLKIIHLITSESTNTNIFVSSVNVENKCGTGKAFCFVRKFPYCDL